MGNLDLLEDACAKLPHTTRAMFGGHGLFAPNGGMFAGIVTDDEIMLKFADDAARDEIIALGGHPWVYNGKMTMQEWIVIPDRFYDDPHTLAAWAARAWKLAPPKAAKKGGKRAPKKAARRTGAAKPAAGRTGAAKTAAGRTGAAKTAAGRTGAGKTAAGRTGAGKTTGRAGKKRG